MIHPVPDNEKNPIQPTKNINSFIFQIHTHQLIYSISSATQAQWSTYRRGNLSPELNLMMLL